MRPFFTLSSPTADPMSASSWALDLSSPSFPGILPRDGGYMGPRPTPELHPHMQLDRTMISVPRVKPGDMVFWHCDVVHAVEREHKGEDKSCVMYIGAVPWTAQNEEYVRRQAEAFRKGEAPPDMPRHDRLEGEKGFVGHAEEGDLVGEVARRAMGLALS
jgi:hypothetical protein